MKILKKYPVLFWYVALLVITYLVFDREAALTVNAVILVISWSGYIVIGFKLAAIQSKLDIAKQYADELVNLKPGTPEYGERLKALYLFVMSRS